MHTINPPKPENKPEIVIDDDAPTKTTKTISPIQLFIDDLDDDAVKKLFKKSESDDDDERSGVYQTEEDKMRIINEAKKKKKRRSRRMNGMTGTSGTNGTSSNENLSVDSVQQANPINPVQPVQQANTIQQVVEPTMQLTLSTLSMQSPHLSDNQAEHLEYVQGLLEQIMNRDKAFKVMKVITGIITHVDSALTINIRNKFVMRRKVDSFMAEIEKQYNLMIDIFVNLLKYAAKNNDYHAHSAIFDLIVEIREKINKLSERVRGCVRILEMQSKINELSEEYFIKYEQNKDINLLDQYRKL
jgi:hypothetical protein